MKRTLFCIFVLLLLVMLTGSAMAYRAGDTLPIRMPASGYSYSIIAKPKYFRYTLINPIGEVVYEGDHELVYLRDSSGIGHGIAWEFYDEHGIVVPAFPDEGTWKITATLYSEFLTVIELPGSIPTSTSYTVESTDIFTNLLAPSYFTFDMGIMAGRYTLITPISIYLIIMLIVLFVVILILLKYLLSTPRESRVHRKRDKR